MCQVVFKNMGIYTVKRLLQMFSNLLDQKLVIARGFFRIQEWLSELNSDSVQFLFLSFVS